MQELCRCPSTRKIRLQMAVVLSSVSYDTQLFLLCLPFLKTSGKVNWKSLEILEWHSFLRKIEFLCIYADFLSWLTNGWSSNQSMPFRYPSSQKQIFIQYSWDQLFMWQITESWWTLSVVFHSFLVSCYYVSLFLLRWSFWT